MCGSRLQGYQRRGGGRLTSRAGFQTCPHSWQRQYVASLTVLLVVVTRADRQKGHEGSVAAADGTALPKALIAEPRI